MTSNSAPARLKPDSRPIAYGAVILAGAIYLGAFATSFFGQAALAAHMNIPGPLQYVVPAVVDLALVLFTMATLVRKSRGETTLWTNLATGFWTLVSIAANVLHVIVPANGSWSLGVMVGAGLSALMPIAALGASLVIENVLIEPARKLQDAQKDVASRSTQSAAEAEAPIVARPARVEPASRPSPASPARPVLAVVRDNQPEPAPAAASSPAKKTPPAAKEEQAAAPALPVYDSLSADRSDSASGWEEMSRDARAERVGFLKTQGLSNPEIASQEGTSLSSVKRSAADYKALRVAS